MARMLQRVILHLSKRARLQRGKLFWSLLQPKPEERILDLGGGDGSYIASTLPFRKNVWIADISSEALQRASLEFGFQTALLQEGQPLPFPDGFFDIVFCNSAIEHVTIPKDQLYQCRDSREFARLAFAAQSAFAAEIRRVAKRYFVQTPHRYFWIDPHCWFPFPLSILPRPVILRFIPWLNRFWIKKTSPDWYLLTPRQMQALFPDGHILVERWCALPKSIIAYKRD